ncbi:unnamed protein product [Lepidochelys olivacea]
MSPEKVALLLFTAAWVLPAGTSEVPHLRGGCISVLGAPPQRWLHLSAGPSPDEVRTAEGNPILNLAPNSLDNVYHGCVKAMKRRLPSLLEEELEENQLFREAWDQAKEMWLQMENQAIFP